VRFREIVIVTGLLASSFSAVEAQSVMGSTLNVEIVNSTLYRIGFCTLTEEKPAKLPAQNSVISFGRSMGIGDIVSVNGQAVKGAAVEVFNGGALSTAPNPGQNIADINLNPLTVFWELTFVNPDGTRIGAVEIAGSSVSGLSLEARDHSSEFAARGPPHKTRCPASARRQTAKIPPTGASMRILEGTSVTAFSIWCLRRLHKS
jgi:hypothetical protein